MTYRIALIGEPEVGKTAYIQRILTGKFIKEYVPTRQYSEHLLDDFYIDAPAYVSDEDRLIPIVYIDGATSDTSCDAAILFMNGLNGKDCKENIQFRETQPDKPVVYVMNKQDDFRKLDYYPITLPNGDTIIPFSVMGCLNINKPELYLLRRLLNQPNLQTGKPPFEESSDVYV